MRMSIILMSTFGLLISSPVQARSHHPSHHRSASHHHAAARHHHSGRHHTYNRRYISGSRLALDTPCRIAMSKGGPCGCYASELVFGHSIRDLWLARNWSRKFPHTSPAVGMAAVRPHHVVIIGAINGDGTFTGRDSWGPTRRSLRGWVFVNPHGGGFSSFASVGADNHWARREEYANDNNPHLTIASWYGKSQRTASGEWFQPNGMTAASKTLPFGTRVRVRYRGRSVVVRINDRGPYHRGRGLDLSRGAARALRMPGTANVSWSRL